MSFPQKRSRFWSILSLWAALFLAAPQLLMACPMMGGGLQSTPDAACCCPQKLHSDSASPASSQPDTASKTCCEKVPLPPSDTSGDSEAFALHAARTEMVFVEQTEAKSTPVVLSFLEILPPQSISIAFPPPTSSSLSSQQAPSSHTGRAPPF